MFPHWLPSLDKFTFHHVTCVRNTEASDFAILSTSVSFLESSIAGDFRFDKNVKRQPLSLLLNLFKIRMLALERKVLDRTGETEKAAFA